MIQKLGSASYLINTMEWKTLRFEISSKIALVLYKSPLKFTEFNCPRPKIEV